MRLWHQKLIPLLPRQQLLGQHRECCALRGKGWGKKHSVVNYVFTHSSSQLVAYHWLVMDEMKRRGYNPDQIWQDPYWRGNSIGEDEMWADWVIVKYYYNLVLDNDKMIYLEHNEAYLRECIENLRDKGIDVTEMEKLYDN